MNHHIPQWHDNNRAFLNAGMHWIELRLAQLLACRSVDSPAPNDDEVVEARRQMQLVGEQRCAWKLLCERLHLCEFERDVLLLCLAIELDVELAVKCAKLHGNESLQYATFALAMELSPEPVWEAIAPDRALRKWNLIEIVRQTTTSLTRQPLRIDERILSFIKGVNHLDADLIESLQELRASQGIALSPSQQRTVLAISKGIEESTADCQVIQMLGPHATCNELIARSVCADQQAQLFQWNLDRGPTSFDLDHQTRLLARESCLRSLAVFVELDRADPIQVRQVLRLTRLSQALVFVSCDDRIQEIPSSVVVDVDKPTPEEQFKVWQTSVDDTSAARLAGQFRLDLSQIKVISRQTEQATNHNDALKSAWDACRAVARPRLDALAQRVEAKASWSDIVLPPEQLDMLQRITRQVREQHRVLDAWGFRQRLNRGFGTTAMFAGDSGCGKTMAAEVIANDLQLDLFRIDLSTVVSKYIGETEKNLSQLFNAAEDGGVVLFFDEADALFGKRSEVKDSHDRFANIEVNYLLQRLETYRGLAILATNSRTALDSAFLRRLRFVVEFPAPDHDQRYQIWQRAFPAQTPLAELDLARLAALHLNGGNIHNIALNAAFSAVSEAGVSMRDVLDSARAEYIKMQRPVHRGDFQLEAKGVRT